MKLAKQSNYATFKKTKPDDYIISVDRDLQKLFQLTQGRVRFGSGSDNSRGENITGEFQTIADTGGADTTFDVIHSYSGTAIGFIVINISNGGVVYDSGDTWSTTSTHLKCSAANAAVTLFLLK